MAVAGRRVHPFFRPVMEVSVIESPVDASSGYRRSQVRASCFVAGLGSCELFKEGHLFSWYPRKSCGVP